jgi:hypothetical protein
MCGQAPKRNTDPDPVRTRPMGVPRMGQCSVASLGKGWAIPGAARLALAHVRGSE